MAGGVDNGRVEFTFFKWNEEWQIYKEGGAQLLIKCNATYQLTISW